MHRVRVEDLKEGMIVARTIFNSDGRVLLHSGIELTASYINRLYNLGLLSIYIKDEKWEGIDQIKDVVSEKTRLETVKVVKTNFMALEHQHKLNIRAVKSMVDYIIDELLSDQNVLVNLVDIRTFDDYTFGHSVNVCILAIMTGIVLGYHDLKLKELGIGALLHDIGKTRINKTILNKPDDLTADEYKEIKRHAEYGFQILRQYDDVPLLSAHVAFQHHERWDGMGYPRHLAQDNIHEYARIVAVADVYDALLADRPYRASYTVNQAITIIKRMSGIHLDPHCIEAMLANIAVYPIGTIVELNTGEIGIVVDVNREMPTHPIVRIVYDKYTRRIQHPHEIDLSKLSTILIAKTLTVEDLNQF